MRRLKAHSQRRPATALLRQHFELRRYGFAGQEKAMSDQRTKVATEGNRVTYDRDARLQEWFENDARGLEHGFTVRERPPGHRSRRERPSVLSRNQTGSKLCGILAVSNRSSA